METHEILILGAAVVILGTIGIYGAADKITQATCLEHGYPAAKVDWKFNRYCIKRVDQTDTVTPLQDARRVRP